MSTVAILGGAAVFCALQALYWFSASRRGAQSAFLQQRLGMDESLMQSNALLRRPDEDAGALSGKLADLIDEAGLDLTPGGWITRVMMWTAFVFLALLILTESLGGSLFLAIFITPLFLLRRLVSKKGKRIKRLEEQLPEALEVMTISLRAGQSLDQTIRHTAGELEAPIGDEFLRVADETELGRPLEQALLAMSERLTGARSVRTFVVSVLVLRQTGGNLIEVLESIIDTMRQQTQYERKLQAMTAEGRSSSRMLGGLPIVFISLSYLADPNYIGKLVSDPIGRVILGVALTLYLLGMFWIRRLINPET